MSKKKPLPYCLFDHPDCFAFIRTTGKCFCLENTKFKPGRDCPFYKPEDQVEPRIIAKKYLEDE